LVINSCHNTPVGYICTQANQRFSRFTELKLAKL
jgi:hypothetical protein